MIVASSENIILQHGVLLITAGAVSRTVGAEPLFSRPGDGDGFRRTGAMLDRQRFVCRYSVLLYTQLTLAFTSSHTLGKKHTPHKRTRAWILRQKGTVYTCAVRISDILQSFPLMSRAVRGTETRYLAVVGTYENGIVSESD